MPRKGKDGKYHSKVTPAPGVKPIYFEARTLREFYERREQIVRDYVTGKSVHDAAFVDMIDEWYRVVKEPRIRTESTRSRYVTILRRLRAGFSPSLLCRAVRYPELQTFVDSAAGECKDTISKLIGTLNAVCKYAVAEGAMFANYAAALQRPKTGAVEDRTALTADQAARLLDASRDDPFGIVPIIGYYTGLRLGEILGLRWQDIDFRKRVIFVRQAILGHHKRGDPVGGLKNEGSERAVPMPEELAEYLDPLRGLPDTFVCPRATLSKGPLTQVTFRDHFDRILLRAGLAHRTEDGKLRRDVTMHWLRHHYATACYRAGVPLSAAMRWLGHTDMATTVKVYTDLEKANFRDDNDDHLMNVLKKVGQKLDVQSRAW